MSSLKLKSPRTIKGRASVCGNLPSIQLPIKYSLDDEIPQYPLYTSPPSPVSLILPESAQVASKKYIISENSMERFAKYIMELRSFCQSLSEVNFCPIIQDVELVEQVDILDFLFKPFYEEALKYIAALRQSEIDHTYVGSSALKQAAFPFVEQWKQFVQLVNKIRDKGIQSMAYYLRIKFQIIDGIIADISIHQKRESVHVEEVVKAAATLRELIFQISSGVDFLILKTDLSKMAPDVLESKIRDMRTLLRLYEASHNSEFVKSGYSISELHQLRGNVQSSILDIIGGLKAAFSFHSDLEKIYDQIGEIHKMLKRITDQINLPQTVVRAVQKKTITDHRLRRKWKDDPLKQMKQFVNETPAGDSAIVILGKMELFIEKITEELGVPTLNRFIDIWERLDNLQELILRRIKSAKEIEKEYSLFQEKIRNQSGQITTLMKTNNRKTAEADETQKRLQKTIVDLEERNSEMLKQRNEALTITKRREEQLFKLRLKFNESGAWKALQEAVHVLSRFLGVPIPFPDDLPKSLTELAFTLNKKGCLKCRQTEDLFNDIRKRVSKAILVKPSESVVQIISNLIVDHQKLKYQFEMSDTNYSKVEDDFKALKDCIRTIESKSNDVLKVKTDDDPDRTVKDLTNGAINAFLFLLEMHKKEIEAINNHNNEQRQQELSSIMKETLSMFPTDKIDHDANISDIITKVLKNANSDFDKLKLQIRNQEDVIEKIRAWMKIRTNTENENFEKMMSMIDSEENPLEKIVYDQRIAKGKLHSELHVIVTKIKGILKVNDPTDYMEMEKLMKYCEALLDRLHDKIEADESTQAIRTREEKIVFENISSIIIRLRALLNHTDQFDFSQENMNSLISTLNDLIDELSGEKLFIDVETINKMTKRIREANGVPHSVDPREYLPILSQKIEAMNNSVDVMKKLLKPLLNIFQNFDFEIGSYDPEGNDFLLMKENVMEMHNIMNSDMKGELVPECSTFLSKDVSLISALCGFVNLTLSEIKQLKEEIKVPSIKISRPVSSLSSKQSSRQSSARSIISKPTSSRRELPISTRK
ncbi:hypothetical protein TRFO_34827 [Tritrichomonas foetus]|uniref:Uncharacterized protein n=1 Tax=Tritrichomonas foetus TaxID=1144522 RepID=A0A1J4JIA9_9EUKA|nr:hypothetical protein TRFO_34827 [Tritrichomonas foetus]|eukprot:OHS98874.1 hypothetical protein TRFO_34827 [Tritrichomonas foetus]